MNQATGEPQGKPRQLTHWAGFGINSLSATADGKELVYRRAWAQRSVHVADFATSPAHISAQRQLTHSEGNELPVAWTADGDTVLFVSNRNGPWGIFKQSLRDENAESLVESAFQYGYFIPGLSVSGESVLYIDDLNGRGFSQLQRLMRVPLAGGRPEQVLSGHVQGLSCARSLTTLCVFGEWMADGKELVFSSLDPVSGRGKEVTRMNVDFSSDYDWDLSPDGSHIAIHKRTETPVQLIPLVGGAAKQLEATGWNSIENLHWTADGKGFYAASRTADSSVFALSGYARHFTRGVGTKRNYGKPTGGDFRHSFAGWTPPCDDGLYIQRQHVDAGGFLVKKQDDSMIQLCVHRNCPADGEQSENFVYAFVSLMTMAFRCHFAKTSAEARNGAVLVA